MNGERTKALFLSLALLVCTPVFAQEQPEVVTPEGTVLYTLPEDVEVAVTENLPKTADELLMEKMAVTLEKAKVENARRTNMRTAELTQEECLATAMYHEARGEGDVGMKAVAFVIYNRTKDGRWPPDVCGVVTQRKQFSFVGDRIPDNIKHWPVYERALAMAYRLMHGGFDTETSPVGDATLFHTLAVRPRWAYARFTKFIRTLGNHRFLRN